MVPDELTPPERQLWDAFPTAAKVDLRTGDPADDDPAGGADWGPERTVRGAVIAALLLGAREAEAGHTAALELSGARITGRLSLNHAEVPHHLRLTDCWFEESVDLYGARTRQLNFNCSHLPGILASHLWAEGSLRMTGCVTTGPLRLVAARIAGTLILNAARLYDPAGESFNGTRLQVENDVLMRSGFTADGTLSLRSARIGGGVDMHSAELRGHDGIALEAPRMQVEGDFSAYRLTAAGKLGLRGAKIAGTLFLRAATLTHPDGRTLDAPSMQIGSDVVLDEGFRSHGEIRLVDAVVGSRLVLGHAVLEESVEGKALQAYAIQIGADAELDHLTATGRLLLSGAHVGGRIDLWRSRVARHRSGDTALSLRRTTAREADLRPAELYGTLDLRYAALGVLRDDPASWPARVRLDGAVYEQLDNPLSAAERLPWLESVHGTYQPQPYEQLAATYRGLGHEDDARRVLLAKQRARRAQLPWHGRAWGLVQDATVGYGYHPARALAWLLGLLAVGAAVFSTYRPRQVEPDKNPADYQPFVYALDVLLPVVDFGQESAYAPHGGYAWVAYVLIAAGWVLATAVAAGAARALNRS